MTLRPASRWMPSAFMLSACTLVILLLAAISPDALRAQDSKAQLEEESKPEANPITDPHKAFRDNLASYREGENVILARVNDTVITSQLIRDRYNDQLETSVDSWVELETRRIDENWAGLPPEVRSQFKKPEVDREEIELQLIYSLSRDHALRQLMLAIAKDVGVQPSEAQVRNFLRMQQELANIDPDDGEAWADHTLERYGITPEQHLERLKEEVLFNSIQNLLIGLQGPVPVPPFPFPAYSLDVTDEEKYQRYLETGDQWKKLGSVTLSRASLEIPQNLSQADKSTLETLFKLRRDRLENGLITFDELEADLEAATADYSERNVRVRIEADITETKEQSIGRGASLIRNLNAGDISELSVEIDEIDDESFTVLTFMVLKEKQEGLDRDYLDPYVQRLLEDEILREKQRNNTLRLHAELFRRAVVLPEGIFDIDASLLAQSR